MSVQLNPEHQGKVVQLTLPVGQALILASLASLGALFVTELRAVIQNKLDDEMIEAAGQTAMGVIVAAQAHGISMPGMLKLVTLKVTLAVEASINENPEMVATLMQDVAKNPDDFAVLNRVVEHLRAETAKRSTDEQQIIASKESALKKFITGVQAGEF